MVLLRTEHAAQDVRHTNLGTPAYLMRPLFGECALPLRCGIRSGTASGNLSKGNDIRGWTPMPVSTAFKKWNPCAGVLLFFWVALPRVDVRAYPFYPYALS